MQCTKISEIKIAAKQTNIDKINCDPKTSVTMFVREAPIALRINNSCVRCSNEDNPILICPNTETNSNSSEVTKSPNCNMDNTES